MKAFKIAVLVLLFSLQGISVFAQPRIVLVFRHAEESKNSGVHLSDRGFARARAIPGLVEKLIGTIPMGAIYAQGARNPDSSRRSPETLEPTANRYSLTINTTYEKWDAKKMVKAVKNRYGELTGKAVVIAWGSDELGDITRQFGYEPKKVLEWNKRAYNRVWVLHMDESGRVVKFSDLAQGF